MAATATKSDRVSGLFDQAVLTLGDALKAGVKIQEEVGKWWSDALEQAGPVTDWQKKSRALVSEAGLDGYRFHSPRHGARRPAGPSGKSGGQAP